MAMQDDKLAIRFLPQLRQPKTQIEFLPREHLVAEAADLPKRGGFAENECPGQPAALAADPIPDPRHKIRQVMIAFQTYRGPTGETAARLDLFRDFSKQGCVRQRIRINEDKPVPGGRRRAGVPCPGDLVHRLEHDRGSGCPRNLRRPVGGIVVTNDEVRGPARFCERGQRGIHRTQRAGQQSFLVEGGNDDGNFQRDKLAEFPARVQFEFASMRLTGGRQHLGLAPTQRPRVTQLVHLGSQHTTDSRSRAFLGHPGWRNVVGAWCRRPKQSPAARRWSAVHCASVVGLLMLTTLTSTAQQAYRASIAGEQAAEAQARGLAAQRANMQLGPVSLRYAASLQIQATDNVYNTSTDRQPDMYFQPQITTTAFWQATERNTLSMTLGLGYTEYIVASEYDGVLIAPGSDVSFNLFIEDVVLNFHDRFSVSQDVQNNIGITGIGSFNRFENVIGVGMTWDLNKMVVSAGYDYDLLVPLQEGTLDQTRGSDLFYASAAFEVNPTTQAGLVLGGGLTEYTGNTYNDNQHVSAAVFLRSQVSDYSNLRLAAGYVFYNYEPGGTLTNGGTLGAVFGDLSYSHRAASWFSHTLAVGRSLQPGLFSDLTDLVYARHSANWNLLRNISMTTSLSYEYEVDSVPQKQRTSRYGCGISFGRTLTRHLNGSVGYQFYYRDSNTAGGTYPQNQLVLNMVYSF